MATATRTIHRDCPPDGGKFRQGFLPIHLVLDADHLVLPASPGACRQVTRFLNGHPEIELTFITRLSAWDAYMALVARGWPLPRHLIAEAGEEILHIASNGELAPDTWYQEWKEVFATHQDFENHPSFCPLACAIEFLECNAEAPSTLLLCLGGDDFGAVLSLPVRVYIPDAWASKAGLPTNAVFLPPPHLEGLLSELEKFTSQPSSGLKPPLRPTHASMD